MKRQIQKVEHLTVTNPRDRLTPGEGDFTVLGSTQSAPNPQPAQKKKTGWPRGRLFHVGPDHGEGIIADACHQEENLGERKTAGSRGTALGRKKPGKGKNRISPRRGGSAKPRPLVHFSRFKRVARGGVKGGER